MTRTEFTNKELTQVTWEPTWEPEELKDMLPTLLECIQEIEAGIEGPDLSLYLSEVGVWIGC